MLTLVAFDRSLQVCAFVRLLPTVTLGMGRACLAHGSAVLTLCDWSALLVDMLEWAV
jgi:hypothetical protein